MGSLSMNWSDKVRYVRMRLRKTQLELAEETKIPISTIIKWENDSNVKPQMVNLGKFIEFCEKNNINLERVDVNESNKSF